MNYFEKSCTNIVEKNYGDLCQTINYNIECEECLAKLQENTRALKALEAKLDIALQALLLEPDIKSIFTNQLSLFE